MKTFIGILLAAILTACSGGGPTPNANYSGYGNSAANRSTNTSAVDHNGMDHGNAMTHSDMPSSPGAAMAPVDLQFLDTMIAHHKAAVEMSMLAETHAQHAEVKELAANIINDQEREIAKMAEWRNSWFDGKPEAINTQFPGMSSGMAGMDIKKLQSLKGNDFDIEFLKQMIPHHQGAIEMAKHVQKQDARAELKEMADDIITAQEAEITQMKQLLNRF